MYAIRGMVLNRHEEIRPRKLFNTQYKNKTHNTIQKDIMSIDFLELVILVSLTSCDLQTLTAIFFR